MEKRLIHSQLKLLQHFTRQGCIPKHLCKKHLHMLFGSGLQRSQGSSWCNLRYRRLWMMTTRDQLPAHSAMTQQFSDNFHDQHRDINNISDRNRLSCNYSNRLFNHSALSSTTLYRSSLLQNTPSCFTVHTRPASYTGKLLEASPPKVQPYLRLLRFDKPIGTYLLFWPCSWSIGLAAQAGHLPDLYLLALFGLGSFVMRGAGCIINDMWDKDIDRKVERTKTRPLASGELTPFQALVFLGGNLSVALTILLQLNWYSVFLGAASMGLVVAYPLAKRYTYWPQVVLGLTFNYGAMLGWCAVKGGLDWPILPLYTGCLLWTLVYDTVYAHQDKYDDLLIGVKSTALKFGDQTKIWLTGFSSAMIGCLLLTGQLCEQTWPYYAAVAATGTHLAHQLYTVNLDNPDECLKKFKSNTQLGALLFLGIVLGNLLKPKDDEKKDSQSKR